MLGETISHYRILEKLGQGGMGEVYLAADTRLDRKVALKFLAPELARDRESLVRFRNEAKAVAELTHPNIATIYDVGEADGRPFLAMEYVDGPTLRDRVRGGPALSVEETLRIAQLLAQGLAEAHAHDIVHRDIKSANIILTPKGTVKILDFGLAYRGDATRITRLGTTLGTIAYMSPEQTRGEEADKRSDIWSLGVVLYECLTGRLPFSGDHDASVIHQIAHVDPDPPSRYHDGLSPEFEAIIAKAMTKDREERYASVEDLLEDLERLTAGRHLANASSPRRSWMRWGAAMVAGVVLTVAIYTDVSKFAHLDSGLEQPDSATARDAVVVLPFAVRGSSDDAGLGEGIVDLLSSKLDGAGSLRSVDPRALLTYIRQREGEPGDLSFSLAVARHFDADLYVTGDVFQSIDRVHVNAALYRTSGGSEPVATTSVEGENTSILTLVDNLAANLLKEQLTLEDIRTMDVGSVSTQSFPALKEYLVGERAFRDAAHGDMDKVQNAKEAYLRAVDLDSTFAIAWYRLAQIADERFAVTDIDATASIEKALAHIDKLSEHDRLHVHGLKAKIDDDIDEAERIFQTLIGMAPDCLDAILNLSRIRHYDGWRRGRPIRAGKELLERAVALDPDNRDSLFRLSWVHITENDWAEGDRLLRMCFPDGELPIPEQVFFAFGQNDEAGMREGAQMLSPLSDWQKLNAIVHVAVFTDDLDGAKHLAELLIDGEHADEVRALGHLVRAHADAAGGRWDAAKDELAAVALSRPDLAIETKALLSAHPFLEVPESERRAILAELSAWDADDVPPSTSRFPWIASHDGFHPLFKTYLTGLLNLSLQDHEAGLESAAELAVAPCPPPDSTRGLDLAQALRGMSAMEEKRPEEALREFSQARFQTSFGNQVGSLIHFHSLERYLRAELLYEMGQLEEALSWFESFAWSLSFEYVYRAPAHLHRARIYEELGETKQAADHYSRFIRLWENCDASLRPRVEEARSRLRALSEPIRG